MNALITNIGGRSSHDGLEEESTKKMRFKAWVASS